MLLVPAAPPHAHLDIHEDRKFRLDRAARPRAIRNNHLNHDGPPKSTLQRDIGSSAADSPISPCAYIHVEGGGNANSSLPGLAC